MKKNIFSNLAFRYIFEIVVIVFSITISFSLQNYQIKLQNNTVKIRYLKRMLNDLKQDSILIDDAINLTQIRMELNDKFIDGNVSGESLTGCVGYYGLNFNDKSYESFSDLSLLNAIDDDSLFSLMTNYYKKHYEQVRDMEDEERLITIELRNYLFPKLRLLDTERITKVKDISIGEWICFLDSDDEWKKEKLEKQINAIKSNPGYKFFHSNEIWIKNGLRINQKKKHKKYGGDKFDKCLDMCRISPSSVMIDKTVFDEVGNFNENLVVCEDYELWLRICDKYRVFFIDEPLIIKYGGHKGQLSYSIESIENHRIKALEHLVLGNLNRKNKRHAIQMLLSKLNIYLKGLVKRKKNDEIAVYEEKIKVWNKFSIEY